MKKLFLFLAISMALASHVRADNGPYHFNRVLDSATSITTTASVWTLIPGSKIDAKKVIISEDSRTLNLKIAFSANDTTTAIASYWLHKPADGIFEHDFKIDPSFGIMIGTTLTGGTLPAATVRTILGN